MAYTFNCLNCKEQVYTPDKRRHKYCSHSCHQQARWKEFDNPKVHVNGSYKRLTMKGIKYYEHNAIWVSHNNMPIPEGCVVHHRNLNRLDNRIENLLLLPRSLHQTLHNMLQLTLNPQRKYWGINQEGGKN